MFFEISVVITLFLISDLIRLFFVTQANLFASNNGKLDWFFEFPGYFEYSKSTHDFPS